MNRRDLLAGAVGLGLSPGPAGAQPKPAPPRLEVEILAEGFQFPEGPIVFPDGSVVFVELVRGTLTRAWGKGKSEVIAKLGGGPNGAALGHDGSVYITNNGGLRSFVGPDGRVNVGAESAPDYMGGRIERVDLKSGKVDVIYYTRVGAHQLRGPNDLVFDKTGGFWFTDFGKTDSGRRDLSALYYARPDGTKIERAFGEGLSFNGVGLSADEKTLFVSDTLSARVWIYDLAAPGVLKPAPGGGDPGRLLAGVPGDVALDGLKVMRDGSVCVACAGRAGIATIRPDRSIYHMPLPDPLVTNLAFGGKDMRDLYVTLSRRGAVAKVRWPEPGLPLNFNPY